MLYLKRQAKRWAGEMKQWEIWDFPIPSEDKPHGFVIISNPLICANSQAKFVNGLICTSVVGDRQIRDYEVFLNGSDGLDWKTAVNCAVVYQLSKAACLKQTRRGLVSIPRRRQMVKVINSAFHFHGI